MQPKLVSSTGFSRCTTASDRSLGSGCVGVRLKTKSGELWKVRATDMITAHHVSL